MQRHIILPALFALLAAPGLASAQAGDFSSWGFNADPGTLLINGDECTDTVTLTYSYELNAVPVDQTVELFTSDDEECDTETGEIGTAKTTQSGTFEVDAPSDLVDGCADLDEVVVYVCARLVSAGADDLVTPSEAVTFDTIDPNAPDTVTVTGGDGNLQVSWDYEAEDGADDVVSYRVYYRRVDDAGDYDDVSATGTEKRIVDLQNDVEYEVYVTAFDEAGNESAASQIVLGTPIPTTDFWELYRERGGPPATGCASSAGAAGPLGLALLLVVAFLPPLRRRRAALLVLAALVALPSVARAQGAAPEESRHWWVEATLGPYQPGVDDDFADPGPYREVFGTGDQLLFRLRIERTLFHFIGQVGVGVGFGYSRASGSALTADGEGAEDPTRFMQMPLELFATYRFDYAALNWGVPLAVFGRAGVVWSPWWVTNATGTAEVDGDKARGARPGFSYGGGLMLHLDALDPALATDFQRSSGVDNTYLFWEWTQMDVDGWGDDTGIDLTDYTWTAGLAIEF